MTESIPINEFEIQFEQACKRVHEMDGLDGGDRGIATIVAALKCGLNGGGIDAAFDALVMLSDVRAAIEKRPVLHNLSMKELYEALDAGGRVSAPD